MKSAVIYFLTISLIVIWLNGCTLSPPGPKEPDSSERIPINTTLPSELDPLS